MSGFFSNSHGSGGNNGTEDCFNNKGTGEQDFTDAMFNTGAQASKAQDFASSRNNGTRNAFNNSSRGKQTFIRATFNTGAMVGVSPSNQSNNGTEDWSNNEGKEQYFRKAAFIAGAQASKAVALPAFHSNGTKNAFNNSKGGKRNFNMGKL